MSDGGIRGAGNSPTKTKASGTWGVNEVHDARLKDIWPTMSPTTQFYVGSFTKQNTTGNQSVTGVGFTPKAIVFWAAGEAPTANGTWGPHVYQAIGFTSGASESYAVAGASQDAVATSNTARRIVAKCFTRENVSATGARDEADLVSFDVDGFTVNWTANSGATLVEVMFLAIGGSGVSAKVVNWTSPLTAINKAVTGVGFTPDVVLHAVSGSGGTLPLSSTRHVTGFGAMDKNGGQWANAVFADDPVSPSVTRRYQRTDKTIAYVNTPGTVFEEASFVSMDADGFTTNFTTVVASAVQYISLCLSGVSAKAGSFTSPTSATTKAVTGAGFQPAALLTSSVGNVVATAVSINAGWALGAYDGTNERSAGQCDRNNFATTEAGSVWLNSKPIISAENSAVTTLEEADIQSLDADGFTTDFTKASAAAIEYVYLALK